MAVIRPCLERGCRRYTSASRCAEHQRAWEASRRADPGVTGRGARRRLPAALRAKALWRARYHCQSCGGSQKALLALGRRLHVHHVNGDAEDNRIENLRVLCDVCHRKAHA